MNEQELMEFETEIERGEGGLREYLAAIESRPQIIDGNLDQDEVNAGYSIDSAVEYYHTGKTVSQYIEDIGKHW